MILPTNNRDSLEDEFMLLHSKKAFFLHYLTEELTDLFWKLQGYSLFFFFFFFSIWVFFHEHSRFTGQQGKGEGIFLTPLYHFQPLHRHLDISRAIPYYHTGRANRGWWTLCWWLTLTLYVKDSLENMLFTPFILFNEKIETWLASPANR